MRTPHIPPSQGTICRQVQWQAPIHTARGCAGSLLWGGSTVGVGQEQKTWILFSSPKEVKQRSEEETQSSKLVNPIALEFILQLPAPTWPSLDASWEACKGIEAPATYLCACTPTKITKAGRRCLPSLQSWSLTSCVRLCWQRSKGTSSPSSSLEGRWQKSPTVLSTLAWGRRQTEHR